MSCVLDELPSVESLQEGASVAWTVGGHHMVGELVQIADGIATISRLTSGAGLKPEIKTAPVNRLRLASAEGEEALALEAYHRYRNQTQKWLEWHDKQFDSYVMETAPDSSYFKDFTLTPASDLQAGRVIAIPDGLIGTGSKGEIPLDRYVFTERVINKFGKVVLLRGYEVSPLKRWAFVTRSHVAGQPLLYGTIVQTRDGEEYVVKGRGVWHVQSQLSPGERVRLKETGTEYLVERDSGMRKHGAIFYSLVNGPTVSSLSVERLDTDEDRIETREPEARIQQQEEAKPVKPEPITHYLPLEIFKCAADASYCLMQMTEQKIINGQAKPVNAKAVRLNNRLYTNMGGSSHGWNCSFKAWELVPESEFTGATTTIYHDRDAIDSGKRECGDHTGLIVTNHGRRFVLANQILVRSTLPSPHCAVSLAEAQEHDRKESRWGWRAKYGTEADTWIEKSGFVIALLGLAEGKERAAMLFYRTLDGEIDGVYVNNTVELDSLPISDVGNDMDTTKAKAKHNDYGRTLLGEDVTGVINETCRGLLVDWPDREVLAECLSKNQDPVTGSDIATSYRRDELETELAHLNASISIANDFLAQFAEAEGAEPMAKASSSTSPAHTFKRGDPITYYSAIGPKQLWWGAKMYAYRVLAYSPGNLDVGLCIKEEEIGRTIFPGANEYGVYAVANNSFQRIEYRKGNNSYAIVEYLQVGPENWVSRTDYYFDNGGSSGPARVADVKPSWEEAMLDGMVPLIARLAEAAATKKSASARKFAKDAMLSLLAQVPSFLQSNIINEVKRKRARQDG